MVRYELQRLPGAPLQRGTVDAGTTLVSLLDSCSCTAMLS